MEIHTDLKQLFKRSLFAAALLLALIGVGLIINAQSAKRAASSYELASDLPRGALAYAQFADLPALLKQWNESQLKERYLASASFQQFQSRHLALKLVSRWEEFNDATGFPIDASVLSSLADNRAAIAVYDIGRLDLVLIAPLSAEKLAASLFIQGKDNFDETELPDGTVYYLHDVEADRGRQKQQIGFANVNGRFILATSEKLLVRTIANLNGQTQKDRLSDDPSFQTLSKSLAPHFVTGWVDQEKLNEDWYFKHYWVQRNVSDLKHIRAGIFDIEIEQGRMVERREFLLNKPLADRRSVIPAPALRQIESVIPNDAPFAQLTALNADAHEASKIAGSTLFYSAPEKSEQIKDWSWTRYDESDFAPVGENEEFYGENRYSLLSYRYNLTVDDPDDAAEWDQNDDAAIRLAGEEKSLAGLRGALRSARPIAAGRIAQPRALDGLLFAEFNRGAIFALQNPSGLDRSALEKAIEQLAANRLMIAGTAGQFVWNDRSAKGVAWRELTLPMLGRSVGYGLRGQTLIVANSPDLLAILLTGQGSHLNAGAPVHELTVIRLSQREKAFDQIFAKLDAAKIKAYWKARYGDAPPPAAGTPSQEFFSGNITSLLDAAAPVGEFRIQRSFSGGRLREEVAAIKK